MCGIIGYIGKQNVVPILIEGLKRLEYRGYDSAGVAILMNGRIEVRRCAGKLKNLESAIQGESLKGFIGIGHTRWATHGRPSEENAHPHRAGNLVLVHNGIIENYLHLKKELQAEGHDFKSETDTEVLCHLIERYTKKGIKLEEAVREALKEVKGSYAIGVINQDYPDKLVAARNGSPLIIGLGKGEFFIASDIPAILNYTRDVIFLEDEEIAILSPDGVIVTDLKGNTVEKEVKKILWNPVMAEKGGYKHFMLKEIYEQPRAIMDTIRGRISHESGKIYLDEIGLSDEDIKKIEKVYLVACGTSWHAALIGKFMIEDIARIPTEVDIASEFRYREPIIDKSTLFVAITQSGETADTLASQREAKRLGARVLTVCNVVGSTSSREADGVIYTHAGPEIGVASTKAFTSQLTALFLLSLHLGRIKDKIGAEDVQRLLDDLVRVPQLVEKVLGSEEEIARIAQLYLKASDFLYLGRGFNYPVALEGALKLKEISYIHAEGYPAGEMKHGPIALIDENLPVVVLAPKDSVYAKVLSNIEEVKTRGGIVIALATEGDNEIASKVNHVIYIPEMSRYLTPILLTIPLQLLAYHMALLRGSDVDQPRNLAKSVTVE
ncbi:MAG: glutamine--fructose-6-phosphate transaminase (isomerizing) [Nitrospirota bacterium]